MNQLIPCPGCSRHVRQSESQCPFCAQALALADLPAAELPRTRLGRAATFAFGATLALSACGGESETGKEGGGGTAGKGGAAAAGAAQGGTQTVTPVYGAPAAGSGNDNGSAGQSSGGTGTAGPVYGAPPSAGSENGSGGTPGIPIYGAAPAD